MNNSDLQMNDYGRNLSLIVEALQTNFKVFAKKTGLSDTYIYTVRDNTRKLSLRSLYKICLGWPEINPLFLEKGTGEPLDRSSINYRFRQSLNYLDFDITKINRLFGQSFFNDLLFGEITKNHVTRLSEYNDKINTDYILSGKGNLIFSNEDRYMDTINKLEEQISLLKKVNDLLENEIKRLKKE